MAEYKIALFDGTQRVLRAEKVLKSHDIAVLTIPVPRHLSSDCGIAIRFDAPLESTVVEILSQNNLAPRGVHPL